MRAGIGKIANRSLFLLPFTRQNTFNVRGMQHSRWAADIYRNSFSQIYNLKFKKRNFIRTESFSIYFYDHFFLITRIGISDYLTLIKFSTQTCRIFARFRSYPSDGQSIHSDSLLHSLKLITFDAATVRFCEFATTKRIFHFVNGREADEGSRKK